jgi:hypothetical protein
MFQDLESLGSPIHLLIVMDNMDDASKNKKGERISPYKDLLLGWVTWCAGT